MAALSVYTLSRREQWQYTLKAWLPRALIGLLLIALVVYADWIIPSRQAADVRGAITRYGTGVVTSFTYGGMGRAGNRSPDQVNITLNGQEVIYSTTQFLLLCKGQRVQVTYRTGKSGNVYVDDITPKGQAKP